MSTALNVTLSDVVNVTVFHPDVTFPAVAITAPVSGATVTGVITITADAADDGPVGGVQFLLNGVNLGTEDDTAPYETLLDTDPLPEGPIELTASARDTAGNSTRSSV